MKMYTVECGTWKNIKARAINDLKVNTINVAKTAGKGIAKAALAVAAVSFKAGFAVGSIFRW